MHGTDSAGQSRMHTRRGAVTLCRRCTYTTPHTESCNDFTHLVSILEHRVVPELRWGTVKRKHNIHDDVREIPETKRRTAYIIFILISFLNIILLDVNLIGSTTR